MSLEVAGNKAEKKHQKYLEAIGGKPDGIIVWSGDITHEEWEKGQKSGYRSTSYSKADQHGFPGAGGKARVIAGAYAARHFPDVPVVATSCDREGSERPVHAEIIAKELKGMKVENTIILEENSTNTTEQVSEALKLGAKMGWKKIAIITGAYHIPRAKRMYDIIMRRERLLNTLEDEELEKAIHVLKKNGTEVAFVSDEKILAGIEGGHWVGYFDEVKKTPGYKARKDIEAQGCRQLDDGTYGTKK